jgi:NAD(P)-dependent dehydrogenase (short-subunit alcohol dehydrogenase family)
MILSDTVALVAGANRGLGARLVSELLSAGAHRVYATARDVTSVARQVRADPRVRVLPLNVTDDTSVQTAAAAASDVNVLVNNAGVLHFGGALDGDLAGYEQDTVTNYFGTLRVTRAFVPVLAHNAQRRSSMCSP